MELALLHLDTHKIVKLLKDKGYSEEQAEGFVGAMQEISLSGVATKQDIHDVRVEMYKIRDELRQEIQSVKVDLLKFQLVQTLAIIAVMITLFQFYAV